jgi:hypothetical protein
VADDADRRNRVRCDDGRGRCSGHQRKERGDGKAGHRERRPASMRLAKASLLETAPELERWDELRAQVPQRGDRGAEVHDPLTGDEEDEQPGWVRRGGEEPR